MLSGTEVGIKGWEKETKLARDLGIAGMVRGCAGTPATCSRDLPRRGECAHGCVHAE